MPWTIQNTKCGQMLLILTPNHGLTCRMPAGQMKSSPTLILKTAFHHDSGRGGQGMTAIDEQNEEGTA